MNNVLYADDFAEQNCEYGAPLAITVIILIVIEAGSKPKLNVLMNTALVTAST